MVGTSNLGSWNGQWNLSQKSVWNALWNELKCWSHQATAPWIEMRSDRLLRFREIRWENVKRTCSVELAASNGEDLRMDDWPSQTWSMAIVQPISSLNQVASTYVDSAWLSARKKQKMVRNVNWSWNRHVNLANNQCECLMPAGSAVCNDAVECFRVRQLFMLFELGTSWDNSSHLCCSKRINCCSWVEKNETNVGHVQKFNFKCC